MLTYTILLLHYRGEQMSESSRFRKEQMRAMASPNKPDLCIRLEDIAVELIFCEFSSLEMGKPKHRDDWRKSVRACKDGYDMFRAICFEGKKTDCDEASRLKISLNDIPSIAILNKGTHLTISVVDTFNGNFFKAYEILDMNLPLKPVNRQEVEDLLEKALHLKTFIEEVVCGVKKVLDESVSLPVDDNEEDLVKRAEALTISTTPYSPNAKHY